MAEINVTDKNFETEVLQSESPCSWIFGQAGAAPA